MAVFKIIKGEYKNKDAIKNVITYIWGKEEENKHPITFLVHWVWTMKI